MPLAAARPLTESDAELACAAVIERRIGASLERVWENVLDWEHLPFQHASSFNAIDLIAADSGGWRARTTLADARASEIVVELRCERDEGRYCTRTLEGPGAGNEVWTRLQVDGPHATRIRVELWVSTTPSTRLRDAGRRLEALYQQLWDEDEAMMIERQRQLDARADRREEEARVVLGDEATLRSRLPVELEVAGRAIRIVELDGRLLAFDRVCPHQLGPLRPGSDVGLVRCPWHGYRFDLRSGRCLDRTGLHLTQGITLETSADGDAVELVVGSGVHGDGARC